MSPDNKPGINSLEGQISQETSLLPSELERRQQQGLETIMFVSVTGGEGCGKTTLLHSLSQMQIRSETARMLGGTPIGEKIREIYLADGAASITTDASVHLMQASMEETTQKRIKPIADSADLVPTFIWSDRSPFDTGVYQGLTAGKEIDNAIGITEANLAIFKRVGIKPTLVLFIDLDPVIGLARKFNQGGEEVTRIERQGLDLHRQVRAGFQTLARIYPDYFRVLEGNKSPQNLYLDALTTLNNYLLLHAKHHIIGQPADLSAALFWANTHPLRAANILATPVTKTYADVNLFIETIRKISFSLRDRNFPNKAELAIEIQRSLLANPFLSSIIQHFCDNPDRLIQRLKELSTEEFIRESWRIMNSVKNQTDYAIRGEGSRYRGDIGRTILFD